MKKFYLYYRRIFNFYKLPFSIKLYFVEGYLYSGFARLLVLVLPFKILKKMMGHQGLESQYEIDDNTYKVAKRISWIVYKISCCTPWESKCLVQALTAQKLLRKTGITSTIYLGIVRDNESKMLAHAWTRCGTLNITGGSELDKFAVVAKFTR